MSFCKKPLNQGFTLFEFLIAMTLLSTISVSAIVSVSSQIDNRNQLQAENDIQHAVQAALSHLTNDIRHCFLIGKENYGIANLSARKIRPYLMQNKEGLFLTTQSHQSMLVNSPESDLANIHYQVRPNPTEENIKQLTRIVDLNLEESLEKSGVGVSQILVERLKEFEIRFWDGQDFTTDWDTGQGDSAGMLPKMAKIFIAAYYPKKEGESTEDVKNLRFLKTETTVYLMNAVGRSQKKTPSKEYRFR